MVQLHMYQNNMKRRQAYSIIAYAGYMSMGIMAINRT